MTETWLLAALWLGLALVATLLSIWLRVATALSEIVVGTVAQLIIGATLGVALLHTEGVELAFTDDAINALARVAALVNATVENIGARRLQTVMERVLDEISFAAPDRHGETIRIDAEYVQKHVGDLARNTDLSRFIL